MLCRHSAVDWIWKPCLNLDDGVLEEGDKIRHRLVRDPVCCLAIHHSHRVEPSQDSFEQQSRRDVEGGAVFHQRLFGGLCWLFPFVLGWSALCIL